MCEIRDLGIEWPEICVPRRRQKDAMKIPAANSAVEREWENSRILAWQLTNVSSKKWSKKQRKRVEKFTFCVIEMDLCHLVLGAGTTE